jgi:hypothetical protein
MIPPMIDEDAFGVLFSYYELEDDEYGSDERADFVQRFEGFERTVLGIVQALALPADHHVLCLGHAVYVEFRDDVPVADLLRAVRVASARLAAQGFVNATVLSYGARWVQPESDPELSVSEALPRIVRISRPSEPLRRALDAEARSRRDEQVDGWGPGVYVDTEALEALGKTPKNAPTVLRAVGAQFFRIPALPTEAK